MVCLVNFRLTQTWRLWTYNDMVPRPNNGDSCENDMHSVEDLVQSLAETVSLQSYIKRLQCLPQWQKRKGEYKHKRKSRDNAPVPVLNSDDACMVVMDANVDIEVDG